MTPRHLPITHAAGLACLDAAMAYAVDAPAGQRAQVADVIKPGDQLIGLFDGEQLAGAFVLTSLRTPYGPIVRCTLAGGVGQGMTDAIAETSEGVARAHGAVATQCLTRRRGLVKKLQAKGYRVSYLLQKDLAP